MLGSNNLYSYNSIVWSTLDVSYLLEEVSMYKKNVPKHTKQIIQKDFLFNI